MKKFALSSAFIGLLLCSTSALASPGMPKVIEIQISLFSPPVRGEISEINLGQLVLNSCFPNQKAGFYNFDTTDFKIVLGAQTYNLFPGSVGLVANSSVSPIDLNSCTYNKLGEIKKVSVGGFLPGYGTSHQVDIEVDLTTNQVSIIPTGFPGGSYFGRVIESY